MSELVTPIGIAIIILAGCLGVGSCTYMVDMGTVAKIDAGAKAKSPPPTPANPT